MDLSRKYSTKKRHNKHGKTTQIGDIYLLLLHLFINTSPAKKEKNIYIRYFYLYKI